MHKIHIIAIQVPLGNLSICHGKRINIVKIEGGVPGIKIQGNILIRLHMQMITVGNRWYYELSIGVSYVLYLIYLTHSMC